jgi:hypothetical protein
MPESEALTANEDVRGSYRFHVRPLQDELGSRADAIIDDNEDVCYHMHSIIVRQLRKDSDEVQKRGERTCTTASKFQFRNVAPRLK